MWIYPKAWQVLQTRTPEQRALLPQPFLDEWSRLQSFEFRLRAMQLLRDDQWKFVDQRIQFVKTLPSGKVRNYNRAHCGYFPHGNMDISAIRAILEEVLSRNSFPEAVRAKLKEEFYNLSYPYIQFHHGQSVRTHAAYYNALAIRSSARRDKNTGLPTRHATTIKLVDESRGEYRLHSATNGFSVRFFRGDCFDANILPAATFDRPYPDTLVEYPSGYASSRAVFEECIDQIKNPIRALLLWRLKLGTAPTAQPTWVIEVRTGSQLHRKGSAEHELSLSDALLDLDNDDTDDNTT